MPRLAHYLSSLLIYHQIIRRTIIVPTIILNTHNMVHSSSLPKLKPTIITQYIPQQSPQIFIMPKHP